MKKLKPNYFFIPLITILIALFGNYFTGQSVNSWYQELTKPEWTPSGAFIGGMWTLIYILTTSTVLVFWNRYKGAKNYKIIIGLFIVNGLLNATWSMLFFGFNLLLFSLIDIIILNLTIIGLIVLIWPRSKILALTLVPYTGWVTVATALNYFIWTAN
jgi:tryptophan-rich sensory protein